MNFDYLINNWRRVLELTIDHLELTAISLAIAVLVAMPLGVLVASIHSLSLPILGTLSVIYTIPSLAALAFLIPSLGLGRKTAVAVLAAYAQLALVRTIGTALRGVDPATLEAARGAGMTWWQASWKVRLPLALPLLIAGLRIAAVTTIGLASVTAWINAGGLGSLLFDGISRDYPSEILAGAVAITSLAVAIDVLLRLAERLTPASRAARAPTPPLSRRLLALFPVRTRNEDG